MLEKMRTSRDKLLKVQKNVNSQTRMQINAEWRKRWRTAKSGATGGLYTVNHKKLDPLLFHHIALAATNCMKISRNT